MKKTAILLSLILFSTALGVSALTNEEQEGRKEIDQRWVDQHNEKLDTVVKNDVKKIKAKKNAFVIPSRHMHLASMRRLGTSAAAKNNIPVEVQSRDKAQVGLVALYQVKLNFTEVGDHSFLVADYADELDPLHASSDIYMKVGLQYVKFFHGEGYRGCARIIRLDDTGKSSPIFFEIGVYGGGSRVDKTIYALKKEAVKAMPQDLYDHPENITPEDYYQKELDLSVWLEGLTSYRDLEKDGNIEVINFSKVKYPDELRKKLEEKYGGLDDNNFAEPFRKAVSIYKWNDAKFQFDDIGDYYY